VIKKEDLNVEAYLDKLQRVFKRMMDQDGLSPHVKFLWVIERLQERWQGIKSGKGSGMCRTGSNGKSTPLSQVDGRGREEVGPEVKNAMDMQGQSQAQAQAQGLHLLSEAAMSNAPQHDPNMQQTDPALLQAQANWYASQQQQPMNLPMDPNAYLYTGGPLGYDGFDYGIGMLGSSMDGAISGLFMPDGLMGLGGMGGMDPNQGQGQYPPW
jgi:hypothetical protein